MAGGILPLTRDKALIFRIAHIDNLPWSLANGIHCRSSGNFDPNYRNIGNLDLIAKRSTKRIPIAPGGPFDDYVPFYFTSRSPMLLNVKSGWGVPAIPMREIIVFVTSLHRLTAEGIRFVFSDRHAYLATARFSSDAGDLDRIDWAILANSNFKADPDDPGKKERYQAEALIHQHLPMSAIAGIICHGPAERMKVEQQVIQEGHAIKVIDKPQYFF